MFGLPPLPRTAPAALRDLRSAKVEIRVSAAADLVRHAARDPEIRAQALTDLERLLREDDAPQVRAAAAVALGDLAAKEALPALLVAVEDESAHVRQMALNALGELGDPRATTRLARALDDARPDVRYQAIIAYARVCRDDEAAVARALQARLADDDPAIRYIALRIAEERLDEGLGLARAPFLCHGKDLMEAPETDVAVAAAILLAKLGDHAGAELLAEVVRSGRARGARVEKEDEQAAVEIVGVLGRRDLVPDLERRAFGIASRVTDTCAFHARIALAHMGHVRAEEAIASDLASGDRAKVDGAVVAAGRARLVALRSRIETLTAAAADPDLVREALGRLTRSADAPT